MFEGVYQVMVLPFKTLRSKIEHKRTGGNIAWKLAVALKDIAGFFYYRSFLGILEWTKLLFIGPVVGFFVKVLNARKKKEKLTIIIPYRDRKEHLDKFIVHIRYFLEDIDHEVVVIEQTNEKLFNRGKLFNVGFDLTRRNDNYFCFHDVDMLPENKHCDYSFPLCPVHLAVFCSQFGYKLHHTTYPYWGGVVLFNREDFEKINGYSNEYWGWGAEDDDLRNRIRYFRLPHVHRWGRYRSLDHDVQDVKETLEADFYKKNLEKLNNRYDYTGDGLSSLDYNVLEKEILAEYTRYTVSI